MKASTVRGDDPTTKILVVDDDEDTSELLRAILESNGYDVVTASGGCPALAKLQAGGFDLVLSDVGMADGDGLELVYKLRNLGLQDVPVILMSAEHDTKRRVASLDLGADDFLPKPFQRDELLARLRAQLRRSQRQAELQRESLLDPLTHVLNRRGFTELFVSHAALLKRRPGALSLLMIDLDDFKHINDEHGHGAGDTVLLAVGDALVRAVRASDCVGRIGGDEFAILMPEAGLEVAHALAARLRSLLPLTVALGSTIIAVSFSLGAATARSDETLPLLMARADEAMYSDKRGRLTRGA